MKIVHCIWSFNVGGTETMLVDIVNRQVAKADVSLIIVNDSYDQKLIDNIDERVKIFKIYRKPSQKSPLPIIRFNMLVHRLHPDIVHFHNPNLPKILFGHPCKAKFITIHSLGNSLAQLGKVDHICAISQSVADDVTSRSAHHVDVVENGVDVTKIAVRPARQTDGTVRIVQVARLAADVKGQDILLDALAKLHADGHKNVTVDFIGEGDSLEQLKQQASRLGVADYVNFLGKRDRHYIYSHLKDYDIMCHPARSEGFGLTVVEGALAGLPLVVPDQGGPFEVTENGRLARIFKYGDADDCAGAIEDVLNNYATAHREALKNRQTYAERYSLDSMVDKYAQLYKKYTSLNP